MGEGEVVKEVRGQEDRPLARRVLENADTKEKKKEKKRKRSRKHRVLLYNSLDISFYVECIVLYITSGRRG